MTRCVVLLHGLRTSSTMWRSERLRLEALGYTVVTPDFPGHGSRMHERFTIAGAMRTIDNACMDVAEPPLVVGLSLGGYLALHWAGLEPRRAAGIVATSCGTQPTRPVLDAWRVLAAGIHLAPDRGLLLNNTLLGLTVRNKQLAADVLAGGVALEVMQDALVELRQLRTVASIARIELPVVFVNGTLDHFRLQERAYLRAARNGSLVHVRGATHLVPLARPVEYHRVLLDALTQLP